MNLSFFTGKEYSNGVSLDWKTRDMSIRALLGLSALATEVSELQRKGCPGLEEETTFGCDFAFWVNTWQHLSFHFCKTLYVLFFPSLPPA